VRRGAPMADAKSAARAAPASVPATATHVSDDGVHTIMIAPPPDGAVLPRERMRDAAPEHLNSFYRRPTLPRVRWVRRHPIISTVFGL